MKGYRTIIFSLAMTAIGLLGLKISPDTVNHWIDVYVAIWGIGAILLRQLTTTPVGNITITPSLTPDDVSKLQKDVETLLGHSTASLQAAALMASMYQKFDGVVTALQALSPAPVTPPPSPEAAASLIAQEVVPAASVDVPPSAPSTTLAPAQPLPPEPIAVPAPAAAAIDAAAGLLIQDAPKILPVI